MGACLRQRHGEVFFYLSHGCCDGSSPLCLAPGEMSLSATDVQLGTVAGAAFWLSQAQRDYLASLQLTLDVAPGSNGGFSLEDGSGQRFVLAMRLFSDDELVQLAHLAQVGTLSAAQSPGAAAAPGPVPTAKS
ncbi:MAG: acetaldehyde dehydrogenase [Burkholderiales bacterium PBB5]|nr:MAG: acetaldehyde dehydrogenase [Burkholderiales bacterium PBB5]